MFEDPINIYTSRRPQFAYEPSFMAFDRYRPGSSRNRHARHPMPKHRVAAFFFFAAPSARYLINPTGPHWRTSSCRSSREISKVSPPPSPQSASTPTKAKALASERVLQHTLFTFQLRGFSPPCWLSPLIMLRACCIPHPVMRFGHFPASGSRMSKLTRVTVAFPLPRTPLEESPYSQPYRIAAAFPFLAFYRADRSANTPTAPKCLQSTPKSRLFCPPRISKAPTHRGESPRC